MLLRQSFGLTRIFHFVKLGGILCNNWVFGCSSVIHLRVFSLSAPDKSLAIKSLIEFARREIYVRFAVCKFWQDAAEWFSSFCLNTTDNLGYIYWKGSCPLSLRKTFFFTEFSVAVWVRMGVSWRDVKKCEIRVVYELNKAIGSWQSLLSIEKRYFRAECPYPSIWTTEKPTQR